MTSSIWTPDQTLYSVLLKRGECIDTTRDNRAVPYKIYHPADFTGKTPLIIWSHGFGGSRDGAAFISRYIAARGYIVMHLTHTGTDSSLWENKKEHPWDILRNIKIPRSATLDRFRDVPFVMDVLENHLNEHHPDIAAILDPSKIGMSGHSFGAMTTQVMAGQLVPNESETLVSFKDTRFTAGIAYSPVPISHLSDAPDTALYGPISMPIFHMTGTLDTSPLEGFEYTHRFLVHDNTDHPEKSLLIKKGGDHMVYNGTRGKLDANPNRERHEEIIQITSLAYWDAHLKQDDNAAQWLTGQGITDYLGDDGEYSFSTEI